MNENENKLLGIFENILEEQKKQTEFIKAQSSDVKIIRVVAWIFLIFYILLPIIFWCFGISVFTFFIR